MASALVIQSRSVLERRLTAGAAGWIASAIAALAPCRTRHTASNRAFAPPSTLL
jgi:hypothetical protein